MVMTIRPERGLRPGGGWVRSTARVIAPESARFRTVMQSARRCRATKAVSFWLTKGTAAAPDVAADAAEPSAAVLAAVMIRVPFRGRVRRGCASRYREVTDHRIALADALRRRAPTNRTFRYRLRPGRNSCPDSAASRRACDGAGPEALAILLDVLLARGDMRGALAAAPGGDAQDREAADPAVA